MEVVFMDAPIELPMGRGDEVPMRTWWHTGSGAGGGGGRKTPGGGLWEGGGGGAGKGAKAFDGWESSLRALREKWRAEGPFHGVVGFSQGAAVGFLLALLAERADQAAVMDGAGGGAGGDGFDPADACFASIRFVVLCAGYAPSPLPIRVPGVRPAEGFRVGTAGPRTALVIAGAGDEAVPQAATWQLTSWFDEHVTHAHGGNHVFPAKSADVAAVVAFISSQAAVIGAAGDRPIDASDGGGGEFEPSEALAEEMEALEAIFDDEMKAELPRLTFTLPGVADALGTGDPTPALTLVLPPAYPQEPPALHPYRPLVGMHPQLARTLLPGLKAAVAAAAEPMLGEPMVYSVVSEAREWLEAAVADTTEETRRRTEVEGEGEDPPMANWTSEDAADAVAVDGPSAVDAEEEEEDGEGGMIDRWWESETTDRTLVEAASREALDADAVAVAKHGASRAPTGGKGGKWTFTLGLVGKPSAGKSTFFNAATELSDGAAGSAKVAAHPFTTIEPNVGLAFAPVACPCVGQGLGATCAPSHGAEVVDGTHCRRLPIFIKDVAGLVPGAHLGRGRGNAFLNDLCDADVLIHVVDASGRSDRDGVDQTGGASDVDGASEEMDTVCAMSSTPDEDGAACGDPAGDVQWVREELHHWIFNNVRRKWHAVRRKPEKLHDMFTGYHCVRATVDEALSRMNVPDPRNVTRDAVMAWTESNLHRLVAHFLRVRFPILLALNKADLRGARRRVREVHERWPGEPCVSLSARAERWIFEARSRGDVVVDAEGALTWAGRDAESVGARELARLKAAGLATNDAAAATEGIAWGGVRRTLCAALRLKQPVLAFPVTDLDTGGAWKPRRGADVDVAAGALASTVSGSMQECVMLKPGSTVWDLFSAMQHGGGASEADMLENGGGARGGAGTTMRGEFVRAECRDGPQGQRRRLLKRDEPLGTSNCVVRFYTNRKVSWQGKGKK